MTHSIDDTLRDLNRRELDFSDRKVEGVLPDYFKTEYPKLITLLDEYYHFNDSDTAASLVTTLFESRDITQTDLELLNYIEDELLLGTAYFGGFQNKRAAAKYSNTLYRSKGTKYSIEQFFRTFFGIDADIQYTKNKIFNVGGTDEYKLIEQRGFESLGVSVYSDLTASSFQTDETFTATSDSDAEITLSNTSELDKFQATDEWTITRDATATVIYSPTNTNGITFSAEDSDQITISGLPADNESFTIAAKVNTGKKRFQEYLDENLTQPSKIGANADKFITDDKLFQKFAIQIKTDKSSSEWIQPYKLFVHPAGMFIGAQTQIVSDVVDRVTAPLVVIGEAEPIAVVASSTPTTQALTDLTGLIEDSSGTGYHRTKPYNMDWFTAEGLGDSDYTIGQLNNQYQSILASQIAGSPTMDDSVMDMSNNFYFETLDQGKHQWWSADSDYYYGSQISSPSHTQ